MKTALLIIVTVLLFPPFLALVVLGEIVALLMRGLLRIAK